MIRIIWLDYAIGLCNDKLKKQIYLFGSYGLYGLATQQHGLKKSKMSKVDTFHHQGIVTITWRGSQGIP